MLSKSLRLIRAKDYQKVSRQGQSLVVDYLKLKYLKNNLSQTRTGLIVGLRISKKAVQRNKIKRQLRAIIYKLQKNLKGGYDLVLIPSPAINQIKYLQLQTTLIKLLSKASLLNEKNYC